MFGASAVSPLPEVHGSSPWSGEAVIATTSAWHAEVTPSVDCDCVTERVCEGRGPAYVHPSGIVIIGQKEVLQTF
jgi:hypothetical protein